ncbi:uncharacterized protein LOC117648644 [Thrips palmi]|uniref:Uncharacterized protein LOC117648644 n=1 Tax=Thrips palmi TaxID=161013 RepID=A0A6P8Z3X8_THRPL|nr:uncharacterized protein LOC117648644 [Thrips palmi]
MGTPGASSASSQPSARLVAVLAIAMLAVHSAGAASVLRAAPRAASAAAEPSAATDSPLLESTLATLATQGEELDAATLQALSALSRLGSLQDDAGTLEIQVPGDVWGLADSLLRDGNKPSERISVPFLPSILPHVNTSCSCQNWQCSCCATVEITPLKRNKTGCATLSYVKDQLAVVLRLSLNNRTLAERELISGSHPPPFCFPVPQLPVITVCLRFSNISLTNDAKIQACAAVEMGLVFTSPLIRLRFGCLRIGPGGVGWSSKPVTHSLNSGADIETDALQQFAAAINATDKDQQFLLLQSILRQDSGVFSEPQPVQLSRSSKSTWPNYQQRIRMIPD